MPIVTVQGYSSGNHLEVTAEGKIPVEMTANVEVGALTATDVTIHDAVTTDNKLKINADGSIPAQLAATYALVTTHHNGAGANANGNTADVEGYGSASIQISGTFEGTISFEGSVDGVNYVPIRALDGAGTPVTSATAAGIFKADCAGLKYLRCPLSGYASGSVTVKSRAVLLASLNGKDFATQTTLAAVLAKLADPATATKQDAAKGVLDAISTAVAARATEATLAAIKDALTDGSLKAQLSGSLLEHYGASLSDRPPASSVSVGATFMVVGTDIVYQSNGTDWVVIS